MQILFLDDDKSRVDEFQRRTGIAPHHVSTGEEFCAALNNSKYNIIMLDHDLSYDVDYDGFRAASYLAKNRLLLGDNQVVIIHSANPYGVSNMVDAMKRAEHLRVSVIHFAWQKAFIADGMLAFRFAIM